MKRRYSYKQLSSLWSNAPKREASELTLSCSSEKAYFKKAMDDICLSAELAESTYDYTMILCEGMKRLFSQGASVEQIQGHHNLLAKIFYLGKDILEASRRFSELFYLGMFIDLKMTKKWREVAFFKFLVNALKNIAKHNIFISKELKMQLTQLLEKENFDLYKQYFFKEKYKAS